ncbi:MAG: type II toxin-antitoxin system VapC family toxin [Pyrinomonadaceae bacterium]
MNSFVLDSSAILAVLNQEKGSQTAQTFFANGIVSAVNLAEILTKLIEQGHDSSSSMEAFNLLQLDVSSFDVAQARKAAELRPLTKHLGLSLGDRSCLALAMLQNATAVTADRDWCGLSFCPIEVIR